MAQCKAKSKRSKQRCLKWAMRGKDVCHFHGGKSKGAKTREGKERSKNAALRHGGFTKESKAMRKNAMDLIRKSKDILKNANKLI